MKPGDELWAVRGVPVKVQRVVLERPCSGAWIVRLFGTEFAVYCSVENLYATQEQAAAALAEQFHHRDAEARRRETPGRQANLFG